MSGRRRPAIVYLFPADWRERYADEVAEQLRTSPRPWRDRLDLLRAVPGEYLSALDPRRHSVRTRWTLVAAALLIATGLAGGIAVTGQLKDGWTEIPFHWWSTLAVLPGVAGLALAALATWSRRRSHG